MLAPDVNVLVYAFREELTEHEACRRWLAGTVPSDVALGVFDVVLRGFPPVVTHPRVFRTPTPFGPALDFVELLRTRSNCALIQPGARHWDIFERLCRVSRARATSSPTPTSQRLPSRRGGCEWVTTVRNCASSPGLKLHNPLV